MKKFVIFYLGFLFLFYSCQTAHAQYRNIVADEVQGLAASQNLIRDPGWESGSTNQWTASSGTYAVSTSSPIRGKFSATWDSNASSQTLQSSAFSIPTGYYGANGVASCRVVATSGTATHTIAAHDGTNPITSATITSVTTGSARTTVNFVFPSSGSIRIRFTSVASNEPEIKIDDCYLALADTFNVSQVNQSEIYGTFTYAQNASCFWNKTANNWNSFSAATCGTGTATGYALAPSSTLPAIRFSNLPPGRYEVSVNATLRADFATTSTSCLYAISDGTTRKSVVQGYATSASGGPSFSLEANFDYTTVRSSITFEVLANRAAGGGNCYVLNNDFSDMTFNIVVKRFPTNSELAYRPEFTEWFVIADITGANPSLGVSSVSSYTEITDSGLTMTPVSGSQAAGIMCSSTNSAATPSTGATTCSAGSESVGANFSIPFAGWYEICFDAGWRSQADASEVMQTTFNVVETPTNAQTLTQECGPRLGSTSGGNTTDSQVGTPGRYCGQCNFSSAGTKGVRLMYEQLASGTPDSSELMADNGATTGQRAIRVTVRPMRYSMSTPLLVNSVKTPYNGVTTINKLDTKSTNYTATIDDETIVFDADGTLTLPAASTVSGKKYTIMSLNASTDVTIDPNGSETVCGSTTVLLVGDRDYMQIQSNGSNWVSGECFKTASVFITGSATTPTVSHGTRDMVSSITRNAAGDYTLNWRASFWGSNSPICTITSREGMTANRTVMSTTILSASSTSMRYKISVLDDGGGSTTTVTDLDSDTHVICVAPR